MFASSLEETVRARPDAAHGTGVDAAAVMAAEALLGRFPDQYRRFLGHFGWLAIAHYEIFGLGSDLPRGCSVIDISLDERTNLGMPDSLIAISPDGGGNHYCFSTKAVNPGEVLFWEHDSSPVHGPIPTGRTFEEWLLHRISATHSPSG